VAVAKIDGGEGGAEARVAAIATRHERTLLRVARQASLCHDDALDAYQRALEIFVRRVETVDPATELSWLKVVVRHEAMAIRRARSESVAGEELDLDAFVPSAERAVEDRIASEERVRRSAEALRALKPDEAKALMMKAHGLSYQEIGAATGWTYTKVNRAITEGRRRFLAVYRGIESGEECERFAPIVEALGNRSASAAQMLQIRPHLRHCTACRAAVRDLHLSRLRRASLFWPVFVVAEPLGRLPALKHDAAALFHRAQASDLATGAGVAGSGGGGRIATVGAVLGLCLGGAGVGTVCVVTDRVPVLGADPPARQAARSQPKPKVAKRAVRAATSVQPAATVAAQSTSPTKPTEPRPSPAPAKAKPKVKTTAERTRKREAKEAAPQEFSFENQAAAPAPAPDPAPATVTQSADPPPTTPASDPPAPKEFSPAEQEFLP
jgi:RNA polymerase sigma factor (sigma-70 family)